MRGATPPGLSRPQLVPVCSSHCARWPECCLAARLSSVLFRAAATFAARLRLLGGLRGAPQRASFPRTCGVPSARESSGQQRGPWPWPCVRHRARNTRCVFGIDFEEGEFRWRRDPRMALPWLPCSQRRPLVARISPKPAARPLRLPDSSGWAATAMWSAARPLRIARSPCLSALAHTSMHAPEASSAAHPLHRLPVGPRRCAARWCAGRGAVSAAAWLLALPRRCPLTAQRAGGTVAACAPAAGAHRPTASLGRGAGSTHVCVRLDHSRGRRRGCRHRRRLECALR